LAGVVLEGGLVDHRDAVLHRADGFADAAAAAGLHVGVVEPVGHDVEAAVRALEPAERALDARLEVDDRAHRPGRELLEDAAPLRAIASTTLARLPDRERGNRHALAHLPPAWEPTRVRGLRF